MNLSAEDFEYHCVSFLQANLQAHLDQIAAQYLTRDQQDGFADPDGTSWVVLKAPRNTSGPPSGFGDYYPGGIDIVSAWPSIEVAVPDERIDNFSLSQYDADSQISLIVQIWLKDGRFPVLNRMMKRYASAVFDVLKTPGALGDASISEARKAWRTNPEVRDENDRITSGALLFLTLDTAIVRS
jgi:hypothetical protein